MPAAAGLVEGLRSHGIEPVALITPRPPRGKPNLASRAHALLDSVPRWLDVCFADTKASLERLVRTYEPDLGLCLGYPSLLPAEVLAIPRLG